MEFYYDLFEDFLVNIAYYTPSSTDINVTKFISLNKIRIEIPLNGLAGTCITWNRLISGKIDYRKMNLLELRGLLYEMAMYCLGDNITKIKMLIDFIEKDLTINSNTNVATYSTLLKNYCDLEAKYKKLCDFFDSLRDTKPN